MNFETFINLFRNKKNREVGKSLSNGATGTTEDYKDRYLDSSLGRSFEGEDGFLRLLAVEIPIVGACINNWGNLCQTESMYEVDGSDSEKEKVFAIIKELDSTLFSHQAVNEGGIDLLIEYYFNEIFTVGRIGFDVLPNLTGDGIEQLRFYDTYNEIFWVKKGNEKVPFLLVEGSSDKFKEPDERFFYGAVNRSIKNPAGLSYLMNINWVSRIAEQMILDMGVSTHNIGNPRMHMKITPPEIIPGESNKDYVVRADKYFDDTVDEFRKVDVDANMFTWSNIEIEVVGAHQTRDPFVWHQNYNTVIEEVISGFNLYPWVLGKSASTTKNWVNSQVATLYSQIDKYQMPVSRMIESLINLQLKLKGINSSVKHSFGPNENPFIKDKRTAEKTNFETVNAKVTTGYISKNQGAQELGYEEAFNQDVVENKETKEEDESNED